uniref:9 kDa salivary protein n=1 Tax=Lutzomyia longipalpis TaxID=7200 RepID=Q5WPS6_LUTLO|nr:9 kDa salivary protein [Lutzomyia longipalpis]
MRNFAVVSLAVAVLLFCAWPINAEDNEEVGKAREKRGLKDAMEHFKNGFKELTKDFKLPSLPSLPGFGKKPESGSSEDSGDKTEDTSGSKDDQSKDNTVEES